MNPARWHRGALCVLALLSCGGTAFAQDDLLQRKINAAVDKGVDYLKKQQKKEGTWENEHGAGLTALAAWTLLECGVPPEDESVQKAAEFVRKAAVTETKVYNVSLDIFFLEHLADPVDIPLIQVLGLRLLAAQLQNGGWTYTTMPVTEEEQRVIAALVEAQKKLIAEKSPKLAATAKVLPQALHGEAMRLVSRGLGQMRATLGDNSNTQFAMLALWVARRNAVPVERAMAMVEGHFRGTQQADGSWWYEPGPPGGLSPPRNKSHAMTCAGLIGLALGHANDKNRAVNRILIQDPQVRAGFARLSKILDGSLDPNDPSGPQPVDEQGRRYYFLWTLERAAVIYDLKKIGVTDWYLWGVNRLVDSQSENGAWSAENGALPDSCFGLLFLKKVNVAYDLTKNIRKAPPKAGRLPPDELLDLLPVEDTTKKPAPKKTPEKPRQSSRLEAPAPRFDGWSEQPRLTALLGARAWGAPFYRRQDALPG